MVFDADMESRIDEAIRLCGYQFQNRGFVCEALQMARSPYQNIEGRDVPEGSEQQPTGRSGVRPWR